MRNVRNWGKFKLRGTHSQINCSSSGHHFVDVFFTVSGDPTMRTWCFEMDTLLYADGFGSYRIPQYFERELKEALIKLLESNPKVYEYNRDGIRRYENLRYHPDDWVENTLKWMKK
jgi:hypothetical protein